LAEADWDPFLVRGVHLAREFASDAIDAKRWTAARIVSLLNAANVQVHGHLVRGIDPKSAVNFCESTVSIASGVADYNYPGNFRKFRRLVYVNSNGDVEREILPADPYGDTAGVVLMSHRRGFRLVPTPRFTQDWTLRYEAGALPVLCFGRLDAGGTTTTLPLKTPDSTEVATYDTGELGTLVLRPDFYNGSYVRWFDASTGITEVRRVTDYAYSAVLTAWVLTLDSALSDTPVENDHYEFLPALEEPMDQALMWHAVMQMKASAADSEHYRAAETQYQEGLRAALNLANDILGRFGPSLGSEFLDPLMEESYY